MELLAMVSSTQPSVDSHSEAFDFVHSFEPIYYFSRAFGLLPFTIIRSTNGEILLPKVSRLDRLWVVVLISLYLYLAFVLCQYIGFAKDLTRHQSILFIGDQLRLIFCLIFASVAIAMDLWNRFNLVSILKKFTIIDNDVSITVWYLFYAVGFPLLIIFNIFVLDGVFGMSFQLQKGTTMGHTALLSSNLDSIRFHRNVILHVCNHVTLFTVCSSDWKWLCAVGQQHIVRYIIIIYYFGVEY